MSDWQFLLLQSPGALSRYDWIHNPRVSISSVNAPIYSIRQQIEMPLNIARDTSVYWSPHYDIPLLYNGKLLATVHDVAHVAKPEIFSGFLKQAYARGMLQALRRTAHHIMFVSDFSRQEFVRLVGEPNSLSVSHIGIDDSWRSDRWKALPAPHPKPYIVYVGNVKPHKNLEGLLNAFDILRHDIPHDLVLIGKTEGFLTGDGNLVARLSSGSSRVKLAGALDDESVRAYVAHAELLVLPSFYEGFGLPPVEAMAVGCPVAASSAASIPEVCGDAALYFDPTDIRGMAETIRRILGDAILADELRSRGAQRAALYQWENCASHVFKKMEMLVDRR
jgi:glycosyltransferase involved in cell wall biosynthesis